MKLSRRIRFQQRLPSRSILLREKVVVVTNEDDADGDKKGSD